MKIHTGSAIIIVFNCNITKRWCTSGPYYSLCDASVLRTAQGHVYLKFVYAARGYQIYNKVYNVPVNRVGHQ